MSYKTVESGTFNPPQTKAVPSPLPCRVQQKGVLGKIRSLFGIQDPDLRPRKRERELELAVAAIVQRLEPRKMMDASGAIGEATQAAINEEAPTGAAEEITSMDEVIQHLAQEQTTVLETSIAVDASQIPALQREVTELLADWNAKNVPVVEQQKFVDKVALDLTNLNIQLADLKRQYAQAESVRNTKLMNRLRPQISSLETWAIPDTQNSLNIANTHLSNLTVPRNQVGVMIQQTNNLIETTYDRLQVACKEFTQCGVLAGELEADARTEAYAIMTSGMEEGEAALPHVKISLDTLDRDHSSSALGISLLDQPILEVREHPSPVLTTSGGRLKITGRIHNIGNGSGPVTLRIGGISDLHPDPVSVQTITVTLAVGASRDFIAHIDIPPGQERTGSVWMEATTPYGDALTQTVKNREPRPMEGEAYVQGEGAVLHNARVIAMSDGIGTSQERLQKYVVANPVFAASIASKLNAGTLITDDTFRMQFLAAQEEAVTASQQRIDEMVQKVLDMTGSSETHTYDSLTLQAMQTIDALHAEGVRIDLGNILSFVRLRRQMTSSSSGEIYDGVMNRYTDATLDTFPMIQDVTVRDDTAAGRAFMSMFQQGFGGSEDQMKLRCLEIESITGIRAERIWIGMSGRNATDFFAALYGEFARVGLGHIFNPADTAPFAPNTIIDMTTDKMTYTDGTVRVSWDIPLGKSVDHMAIYQTSLSGSQPANDIPLVGEMQGVLTTSIPLSSFRSSGQVQLKLAIWFTDGTTTGAILGEPITIAWSGDDSHLSTLSNGHENKDEEEIILSLLQKSDHLYFDDLPNWTWSLASTAHDGSALNAIDFIRGSADKAPVVAPYKGTVVLNQLDNYGNSTLILEHKVESNSRTIYFYTKYLHMHVNADNLVYRLDPSGNQIALMVGKEIQAGEATGLTGSVGQSSGEHLHEETFTANNGERIVQAYPGEKVARFFTTPAIDQRLLLTTGPKKVTVVAAAGHMDGNTFVNLGPSGRLEVGWNDKIDAWVNTSHNVIYDRREQQNLIEGNGTYWLAYEEGKNIEQMERVAWDGATGSWYQVNSDGSFTTDSTGRKRKWVKNSVSNSFEFIWQ